MIEICRNCEYKTELKHNFVVGKGYEKSFCCIVFANEKDGNVVEVKDNDCCEMFKERGGDK